MGWFWAGWFTGSVCWADVCRRQLHRHKEKTSKGVEKSLLKVAAWDFFFCLSCWLTVFGVSTEPLHYTPSDTEAVGKWKVRRKKNPFNLKDSVGTRTSGYEPSTDVLQIAYEKLLMVEKQSPKAAFKWHYFRVKLGSFRSRDHTASLPVVTFPCFAWEGSFRVLCFHLSFPCSLSMKCMWN